MTDNMNFRLITFFSGVAFVLIILLVSMREKNPISREEAKRQNPIEMKAAIDSIRGSLRSYGIDDTLFKEMNKRELKKLNVKSGYTIAVPYDVSIPVIINDIENRFAVQAAYTSSKETKIGLEFESIITDNAKWKLCLRFLYKPELKRQRFEIAPVVEIKDISSDSLPFRLLEEFENGTFILPLTKASEKVAEKINAAHCNYMIDISEQSDAQEYKLDETFTKKRLNESIEEIIKSFPYTRYFFLRINSPTYNSVIFPYFKRAMNKRGIGFVTGKDFNIVLPINNEKAVDSVCITCVNQTRQSKSSILLTEYGQWSIMKKIIARAERLGALVTPIDSVMRKQ